jgi:hypothetical protein
MICGVLALIIHFVVNRAIDAAELYKINNIKRNIKKAKELGQLWVVLKEKKSVKEDTEFFWKIEMNINNGVCISYKNRYDDQQRIEYLLELMLLNNHDGKPFINFRQKNDFDTELKLGIPVWNTKIVGGYKRLLEEVEKIKDKYKGDIDIEDIMSKIDRIEFYDK